MRYQKSVSRYACCRSSPITRATHGMFVSMKVGSVSPELIISTSAFSATRIAMWLLAPSIVPSMPQTPSL